MREKEKIARLTLLIGGMLTPDMVSGVCGACIAEGRRVWAGVTSGDPVEDEEGVGDEEGRKSKIRRRFVVAFDSW